MSDLPTPDVLEETFHRALKDGDAKGVGAALLLMTLQDPRRAQNLMDSLEIALHVWRIRDNA